MLWFILFAAIGIYIGWRMTNDLCSTRSERILLSALFCLAGSAIALFPFLICTHKILRDKVDVATTVVTYDRLVSLRSADRTSGSFFLGSGSIGTDQYYFFYKDAGNGGYKPDKIRADGRVTIFEENRQDGRLVYKQHEGRFINRWYYWLGTPFPESYLTTYEFHIPQGSLQKKFQLE